MSATIEQYVGKVNIPADIKTAVNRQWANRPADQRFAELNLLRDKVEARRQISVVEDVDLGQIRFLTCNEAGQQSVNGDGLMTTSPKLGLMVPTHWAFGQTSTLLGAPSSYLRKLPADLAAKCLNHGLETRAKEDLGVKLYGTDGDDFGELRATTSQTYGRIWDIDVVNACERIVDASNGEYFSPWAWGKQHRALFASDRDVFMFFCNGGSLVDGGGERDQLYRGFYVWNSEVGSATFGLATFLFRVVCGNFQIWDMKDASVLKIRHTSGGPERFVSEAVPALKAYTTESVTPIEATIKKAKGYLLPMKEDECFEFFQKQGFSRAEVRRARQYAEQEEGQFVTLWDAQNGLTAYARTLAYSDAGVELSTRAGKLMQLVQ